jgi:hypothetical protein
MSTRAAGAKLTFPGWRLYLSLMRLHPPPGLLLGLLASALIVPALLSGVQDETAPPAGLLRTFFSIRSARIDETLGADVRKQFEDDDGSPLRSVDIDLDGDGTPEKFVLDNAPSSSGGSQWLVWDPVRRAAKGLVIGAIIFVGRESDDGFPRLETYWRQGGDMAVVFDYVYSRGRYVRVKSRSLSVPEIDEYFRIKPPLDFDKELVEIKAGDVEIRRPRS